MHKTTSYGSIEPANFHLGNELQGIHLASFNRYTAEVHDAGLIIYTGGFPSTSKARLFRMLDEILPENICFFHWGDIDLGGLRILVRLQSFVGRKVTPHLMGRSELARAGVDNDKISEDKLKKLAAKHTWTSPLVESILSFSTPRTLEQESVDPVKPDVIYY